MRENRPRFAIVVFLFLLFGFSLDAGGTSSDLVRKVQPATVIVYVYDQAGKGIAQGSGFLLNSRGRLITNYHVLGKGASAKVRTPDDREFSIKAIVAQDPADDLIEAVVDITSGSLPYLTSASTAPKPGDPVTVVGSPYGVSKVISHGNVTAIQEIPNYGKCIIHSAHSFPGSSGSPLVNDRGEVIGIATAGAPGKPDVNIAVPVERFSGLSPNYRQLKTGDSPAISNRTSSVNTLTASPGKDATPSETNDPAALVKLGLMHELGQGAPKNCFDALRLYRKAADQGFAPAEYHLGRIYYEGGCTSRILSEAARLVRKSAEKEFPDAQKLYGDMCFNGEGAPRDRVTACMWTILAASRGQQEAVRMLRYMESELTQAELQAAREKAKNWKPAR